MKSCFFLFMLSLTLFCSSANDPKTYSGRANKFIENKGQFTDDKGAAVPFVLFKSTAPGVDYFITTTGITYLFTKIEEKEKETSTDPFAKASRQKHEKKIARAEKIELFLENARISKTKVVREKASNHHYNYFFPGCPDGLYDVQEFEKITFKEVYPGIDWVLYGNSATGLKYDFILHPGARSTDIQLVYKSALKARLNDSGDITIKTINGELREKKPYTYLQQNSQNIKSEFILISSEKKSKHFESHFTFAGDFSAHSSETILIDPQLVWSTLIGGSNFDGATVIETDTSNNVFVAGYTYSSNFPTMNAGTYYQSVWPSVCAFIMKFNNSGVLLWSTYYGGSGGPNFQDFGPKGLAIDKFGNVFVVGQTGHPNFPVQNNGGYFQAAVTNTNSSDMYILKFTNNGIRLWATLYGGTSDDMETSIDTDISGSLYITGRTFSTNFPLQNAGGFYQSSAVTSNAGIGFIVKFDSNSNRVWSTYYGNWFSYPTSINCDVNGNMFVVGYCNGNGVPVLNPGGGAYFQATPSPTISLSSCFISKFDALTNQLWSTLYYGTGSQVAYCAITDPAGNLFVGGITTNTTFPLLSSPGAYFQNTSSATSGIAFIIKFNNAGVRQWASLCGGTSISATFPAFDNMALDPCNGDLYFTFYSSQNGLLTQNACGGGYLQTTVTTVTNGGYPDAVITKFSNAGALLWSTYFGGDGNDFRSSIATDNNGGLFMTGEWMSQGPGFNISTYPLINPGGGAYFDNSNNGSDESYLCKFMPVPGTGTLTYVAPICNSAGTLAPTMTGNYSPGGIFSSAGGLVINPTNGVITASASTPGSYTVSYQGPPCPCYTPQPITRSLTIGQSPSVTINSSLLSICMGQTATLSAVNGSVNCTYSWTPGGFNTSSIIVSPTVSTNYTLITTDVNSTCFSTSTLQLVVNPLPTPAIAGPTIICENSTLSLVASGASTYSWNTGQTASTITLSVAQNTVINLTGYSAAGCSVQTQFPITVLPLPIISVSGQTAVCKGTKTLLTATGASSFQWSTGSTANSTSLTISQNTSVTLTGTGNNGCQKNLSISLVVANCNAIDESELNNEFLLVYPNPSSGEITIQSTKGISLRLEDERGRLIQTIEIDKDLKTINFKLSEGIYFLRGAAEGKLINKKIVISK